MPIPVEFLTQCKVYTDCLKCGKTLKSTRGERSHLQQCCFDEIVQRAHAVASGDTASDAQAAGTKRTHSQRASSVASNSCTGSVQSVQNETQLRQDSVLQLEVTGGHGSMMVTPKPFRFIAIVTREATFAELDCLLRSIWFECCGHLSSFKLGADPVPNKHPDKLAQQAQRTRQREQHEYLRPAITPSYKIHTIRCPPSRRDPVVEALDAKESYDHHNEWLGRPEVQEQMREIRRMRAEDGEYGSDSYSELESGLEDANREAEQAAAAQAAMPRPDVGSRLVDWLTLPGQVMGYSYNGHDIGSDAEIKVGDWHTLNEEVRSRLGNKTVMVLTRNQQPRPECGHCSQPSQVAYFRYYPNYDPPEFYCNDCIKLIRPSYGAQHGEEAAAEAADDGEKAEDDDDDEAWMQEDADQRAHNKAVALANTPQLGQCGVRGQPNRSCYDMEDRHVVERVMWQW